MKKLNKFGIIISGLVLLLTFFLTAFPVKTYAAEVPPLNSLGSDPANRTKFESAIKLNIINQGQIRVDVNITENIFKSINDGVVSYSDAFSDNAVDTNLDDDNWIWSFNGPGHVVRKEGGGTAIYSNIYIVSKGGAPPDANASQTQLNDWLSKLKIYPRIYLDDSGNLGTDAYFFFIDILKDGDCNWGWHDTDCSIGFGGAFGSNDDVFKEADIAGLSAVNVANRDNIKIKYAYSNGSIVSIDGKHSYRYAELPGTTIPNFFTEGTGKVLFDDTAWKGKTETDIKALFDCDTCTGTVDIKLGDENDLKSGKTKVVRVAQSKSASNLISGSAAGGGSIELNCDVKILNPLSWFMCPLIEAASHAVGALDTMINGQLTVPVGKDTAFDESNTNGSGGALYESWLAIRNIALALLVIIALVMVISQAIGSGPFDAYTVKKVLPRLVVAVIFTTLSWQICKLLVGISNDFGQGIGSIIEAPFRSRANTLSQPTIGVGGSVVTATGIIAAFFGGLDMLVILSLVLTALASVFVAFLVIAFRNILIILLTILAPFAFICWILPNTQKAWKFWRESFQGALLSFPIIIAFITTGRVFAIITENLPSKSNSSLFEDIIIFIAYFGPYFALPAAFKLAGGAVATIGGMANDRSKGFFDRNRKFRDSKKKEAVHRREAGALFKGAKSTGFRSRMNKITAGAYATKTLGYDPRRWKGQMHAAHTNHSVAGSQEMLQDKEFARVAGDDNWNYAASVAKDDNDFRAIMKSFGRSDHSIEEDLGHYKNMMGKYGRDAVKLATFEKTAAGGTVYGTEGRMSSIDAAQRIADGNSGMQAYLDGRIRGISAQAGRPDEGMLNHGAAMAISNMARSGMWMDDKGQYTDANGNVLADQKSGIAHGLSADAISDLVARRSFEQSHGSQWMAPNVKGHATKKGIKMLKSDLENSIASGSTAGLAQSIVKLDQMVSAASSPEKTALLAEGITSQRLSDAQITALQDNPEFMKMYGDRLYEQKRVVSYDEVSGERVESVVRGDFRKDLTYSDLLNLSRGTREVQERSRQYESPYGHAAQPEGAIPTNTIPGAGP